MENKAKNEQVSISPDINKIDIAIKLWKSRLLDLSRRNRLIYFRSPDSQQEQPKRFRPSYLRILSPNADELFQALVINERKLNFSPAAVTQSTFGDALEDKGISSARYGDFKIDVDRLSYLRG